MWHVGLVAPQHVESSQTGRSSAGLSARGEGSLEPTLQTASFSSRSHSVTAALSQHLLVPGRGLLGSRCPGPLSHPPQPHFILFSSHALIREARGGPGWLQDVDPSGNLKEAPDSQSPQGGDDKDQMGSLRTRVTCASNAPIFPGSVPALVMVMGRWGQGWDMSHGQDTSSFSNLHKPRPHGAPVATIQGLRGTVNPICSPVRLVLSPPPSLWGPAKDLGTAVEAPTAPGLSGTQGPSGPPQGRIVLYNLMLLNKSIRPVICIPSVSEMLLTPATRGIQGMHLGQGVRRERRGNSVRVEGRLDRSRCAKSLSQMMNTDLQRRSELEP